MHHFGVKSRSITPLRQPFETQISENGTYRSIGRWRSRFLSLNDDDYLSPSFLDDASSLSSSPLFNEDTPRTVASNASPSKKATFNRPKFQGYGDSNSGENTPLNHRVFRRCTSTGTPIFTSPTKETLDCEGFIIPDLPGSTKRKIISSNRLNCDASVGFYGSNTSEPVHITMPPRLGLPSQTPLNLKDQYKKSPLPIVSANLDYRTAYMGDKLTIRANTVKNKSESHFKIFPFQGKRLVSDKIYNESPSGDCFVVEDDYVLHHGELLRSRYLKHRELCNPKSYSKRFDRSRSLSSYYIEDNFNYSQSPGYRSNSVSANCPYKAAKGRMNTSNIKKRRIGSYIASNDELLQQHIQLIDKSLERCSKESEGSIFSSLNFGLSNEDQPEMLCSRNSRTSDMKELDSGDEKLHCQTNLDIVEKLSNIVSVDHEDQFAGVEETSTELVNKREFNITIGTNTSGNEVQAEGPCFIDEFENIEPIIDTNVECEASNDCEHDSGLFQNNEEIQRNFLEKSIQKQNVQDQSPKSFSSLEEMIPHPISHSESILIQDFGRPNSDIKDPGANDSNSSLINKPPKSRKNRMDKRIREKNKHTHRKKHIDYHIPIDQVKPHRNTIQRQLTEDCSSLGDTSRRYPRRLRTAPLKWYLGERLEYHRDERSELGYTIAAIHKVADPEMLPNERGSIYPVDECITNLPKKPDFVIGNRMEASSCILKSKKCEKNISRAKKGKRHNISGPDKTTNNTFENPNAVVLKDKKTNESFTMMAVFERSSLCWADVEYSPGKPYSVALSFVSSQATCCEICLPPLTEKGLDESQDNYILGHVYMAPDNKSLQIMISDNNVYNIGLGDWFLIPDNTNYNFSNTSDHSEIIISLYVIKEG